MALLISAEIEMSPLCSVCQRLIRLLAGWIFFITDAIVGSLEHRQKLWGLASLQIPPNLGLDEARSVRFEEVVSAADDVEVILLGVRVPPRASEHLALVAFHVELHDVDVLYALLLQDVLKTADLECASRREHWIVFLLVEYGFDVAVSMTANKSIANIASHHAHLTFLVFSAEANWKQVHSFSQLWIFA